jgi:hypothetical protein
MSFIKQKSPKPPATTVHIDTIIIPATITSPSKKRHVFCLNLILNESLNVKLQAGIRAI